MLGLFRLVLALMLNIFVFRALARGCFFSVLVQCWVWWAPIVHIYVPGLRVRHPLLLLSPQWYFLQSVTHSAISALTAICVIHYAIPVSESFCGRGVGRLV